MNRRAVIVSIFLLAVLNAAARTVEDVSSGWSFTKDGVVTVVDIPHTWNAEDTADDVPGYWRGACEYSKTFDFPGNGDRRVFLRVGAANQVSEVFVNGRSAGIHKGGYTAFCHELTPYLQKGANRVTIKVDNSYDGQVAPLSADFTFYGGIYRRVELIMTGADCISPVHYASSGVYVTPVLEEDGGARVDVTTMLSSHSGRRLKIEQRIYSPSGKLVAKVLSPAGGQSVSQTLEFDAPELWDVRSPSLYRLETILRTACGRELDRVSNDFGVRSGRFDPDKGFFLNGRPLKLMGAARHQDYEGIGNALPDGIHASDVALLKRMGGNFIRPAHYPQDAAFMHACDRCGVLTSLEIPIVDHATISREFTQNQLMQAREMVYQNFNSPSVILWGYMNEAILHISFRMKPTEDERLAYYKGLYELAVALNSEIKSIDPSRQTLVCFADDIRRYSETGITSVPDVHGWNLYRGWYGHDISEFGGVLDLLHETFPDKPLIVSEYGAGVDARLHSDEPERFDFSVEYGVDFHKRYSRDILDRDFISGGVIWALSDFYSEARIDATPHVNNKGITGLDRTPKDMYLYYRALLREDPVLAIGGHDWTVRSGRAGEIRDIPVYCNRPEVSLSLNGKDLGTRGTKECTAAFPVALEDGMNVLVASSDTVSDTLRVTYHAVDMKRFTSLRVMMGGSRYYSSGGLCWIPEKPYTPGSWGFIGGHRLRPMASGRENPCHNADIKGTHDDPLYQSQRVGISAFKADVPPGPYRVVLHFAELAAGGKAPVLAYNLGHDVRSDDVCDRVFDVRINGGDVLKDFNIRKESGALTASVKTFDVLAGSDGLSIDFIPRNGEPVLNSIEIISQTIQ